MWVWLSYIQGPDPPQDQEEAFLQGCWVPSCSSLGRLLLEPLDIDGEPIWQYDLRWFDTVFQGQYLPSLSINYVTINKDLEKLPPQLY